MKVERIRQIGTWLDVLNAARTTMNLDPITDVSPCNSKPRNSWKKRILLAEHSPIRLISFDWVWKDIPSWVSVHFVRHKYGIEHFVGSQRSDRTGIDRNELPQKAPVVHQARSDIQEMIHISRKRLCNNASPETRCAWKKVCDAVKEIDPIIASVFVPECVYRGFCPEMHKCGHLFNGYDVDAYRAIPED